MCLGLVVRQAGSSVDERFLTVPEELTDIVEIWVAGLQCFKVPVHASPSLETIRTDEIRG
ncbi:hypothetical protein GJ744_001680 [Endocarpon pusillum]|uniref:Uncharacterized protein n=1 Tax=Endocarpon pusillum TaxID=364733 RepID=A0A8H7AC76_9EURO|nr:hypothetical protein GJ744_001680 [Endocarpon pusillum]